ncbi:MAG: acetyl-CoA carboxylase biotin carboxyl carrier protein [Crocinitomicaceae bacterium]|nr:acetyl-CoA carboxylase biotin carboxyl carrier protein [Crocinitomicaceae bacterium]
MNITQIQDLIKFVSKSGVSEVEIEQKDFKITIKTHEPERKNKAQEVIQVPVQQAVQQTIPVAVPVPALVPPTPSAPVVSAATDHSGNLIEIRSPMIGTFYRASAPDKPAFVEVGASVKVGDTVCVIEAMKLFNEIESEVTGKIVKVLVNDSTPVEYDQPLFLVEPA